MKNTLTRMLALVMALLLLLPAALAQDSSSLRAELDALRQKEEHLRLEMQIVELELQRATLMMDDAAAAAAQEKQKALQNDLQTLLLTRENLSLDMLEALEAEEDTLLSALAMIASDLTACDAALEQLDDKYAHYLMELFDLGTFASPMAKPEKLTLSELEAEYETLLAEEQLLALDLQISDLRLQQAQVQQDQSALAEAAAVRTTLLDAQKTLTDRKCALIDALLDAITAENDATIARRETLLTEAAALETSLVELSEDFVLVAEAAAKARLRQSIVSLFPGATAEELQIPAGHDDVTALYQLRDESGQVTGWYVRATARGYVGPVAMIFAIDQNGWVTHATVGDDAFVETAGFGQRWLDEERTAQLTRLNTRQDGVIEAITGATITSSAVLKATNAAFNCINDLSGSDKRNPVVFGKLEREIPVVSFGGLFHASARGFQSLVDVSLSVDNAGRIQQLQIDTSRETAGFGGAVMNKRAFISQFEGKAGPFRNIDGISGATITSDAVVTAVNAAWETAVQSHPALQTATAKGFQSDVKVQLLRDEQQRITVLLIDTSGETQGFGTRVMDDEAFQQQFIGKVAAHGDVDALSGATITSRAVINAINSLAPVEAASDDEILSASARGLLSDVTVYVMLSTDGAIAAIAVDCSGETQAIARPCTEDAFLRQFIGRTGPFTDIDVVSGATFTSNAVINAVNSLYSGN